jgi:hypothetical protein
MKKVGIISLYYKTYNYGAQLQAYALQKVIEKMNYECEQICYKWQNSEIEFFYSNQTGSLDKFRRFSFRIPHSEKVYDPSNIQEANEYYDILICGSDQIWGVENSMARYVVPHMCLSFAAEDKIKFSYGASFGSAKLTTAKIPSVKYWTSKLDKISMREQSAISQISEITHKSVVSVLDPTFLLEQADWDKLIFSNTSEDNYIFVYNIGNNRELDKSAKILALKNGYMIKTLSYSKSDESGPIEFISLVKNAKYVLTNSFHGTCFSIIFCKQFYAFPADNLHSDFSKNIRITDLLDIIGEKSRFIIHSNNADFDSEINYNKVNALLQKEKEKSLNFIKQSLKLPNKSSIKNNKDNKYKDITSIWDDFIQGISDNNSSLIINYENQICENYFALDTTKRNYYNEIKRNSIYIKLLKYQMYGCVLDDEPFIKGKVVIYGAGKIGRLLSECSNEIVVCFVDNSDKSKYCNGYPICQITKKELKQLIGENVITFIITPIWDFEEIYENIITRFPFANVVSVEKVVEKLWE